MSNDTVKIQLQYPVEIGEDLIDEISLRRPKGKDLKKFMKGQNSMAESMALAAHLSGQLPVVFDEMDASDLTTVLDEVGNFVTRGR